VKILGSILTFFFQPAKSMPSITAKNDQGAIKLFPWVFSKCGGPVPVSMSDWLPCPLLI